MRITSDWHSFSMIAVSLCVGTMGTALASPLYPIYQQLWQLQPSDITLIFITYMFGCLATLLFLGRLSTAIGFAKVMQIGLLLVALGSILCALATAALYLEVGRFLIGIASGLLTSSAMLGLIQTIPERLKQQAPQFSSIITVIGFGLGPLLGGVLAQFLPHPLIIPYLPIIVLSLLCCYGIQRLNLEITTSPKSLSFAPHLEQPKAPFAFMFYVTSITAFAVFAIFSLYASLAPSFIADVTPWQGPLVSGLAITSLLAVSGIVQFFAKSIPMHRLLNLGLILLILSCICLAVCMFQQWSILFFISDILAGLGHGLALLGAFALIHKMTHLENRAAVFSTYLFIAYLGTIVPIVAVGYLADHLGLKQAVIIFSAALAGLCILLLCLHPIAKKRLIIEA